MGKINGSLQHIHMTRRAHHKAAPTQSSATETRAGIEAGNGTSNSDELTQ